MERIPRQFYTDEFRHEAVSQVVGGGWTVAEVITSKNKKIGEPGYLLSSPIMI
jgi:hypothetical protein